MNDRPGAFGFRFVGTKWNIGLVLGKNISLASDTLVVMAKKKMVVIDGKSVFYRGYYAMPHLSLPDGTPSGGVYGFTVLALQIIKMIKPDYVFVAWDKPKTNIRSRLKIYPEYKAGRKPMPDDMREQIPYLHKLLEAFGWPLYECDDYEADDIIGTLAVKADKKDIEAIMVTSDMDMLQMVGGNIKLFALKKGLSNIKEYDDDLIEEEFGFSKEKFDDYKALKGDSSDNIPGVKGVGEKTARELVLKYETLENIYDNIELIKDSVRKKLEADKEMAYLSRDLVRIMTDAPVELDLKASDINNIDIGQVQDILHEYKFRSLLNQLPESWEQNAIGQKRSSVENPVEIKKAKGYKPKKKTIVVAWSDDTVWISESKKTAHELSLDDFKKMITDNDFKLIGYDLKNLFWNLLPKSTLPIVEHDVRMGAFLVNALSRDQSLTGLFGGEVDEDNPAEIISVIWQLYEEQTEALKDLPKVKEVAEKIEWPMVPVLARIERRGIKLDASYLHKMSDTLGDQISDVEQEIYGHADTEFNISSPSQLADILYTKLNLPTQFIKKTKSGFSTAHSELTKLKDLHPIIELVFKYREWTKLKSTYVDTLPNDIAEDGRIHTTFDVDVAASGRLSSRDPNLMNIPVRTELGKTIRNAFLPEKGNLFVVADYSQFELRLAAALSGDKDMIDAFNEDRDIHVETAALVSGIDAKSVSKEQRYAAKAVNFGIMYGLSPHGLSQGTGMTMAESKEFIDKYFELRKPLKTYIEQTLESAKTEGYVETLFGRRRPTPDVKSSNFVVREAAKRAAQNHPIQGTEADLMKMAMIEIEKKLPKGAEQILQIHDSILVECDEKQADKVAKLMRGIMESIYTKLPVKLTVDTKTGKTWGEL